MDNMNNNDFNDTNSADASNTQPSPDAYEDSHTPEYTDAPADSYCYYDENYTAQRIHIPPVVQSPDYVANKKGLKVFCGILAAVILLSCFTAGGYFLGRKSADMNQYYSATELELVSKPTDTDQLSNAGVYNEVKDSIVGILVYNGSGSMSEATGVVYSEDGYIITNDHIYSSVAAAKFKVFTNDRKEYNAVYVAGDTRSDLAVIKITDSVSLKPAIFGNSDEVIAGEQVCAVGCPNGYSADSTITGGMVSVPKVRMSITSSYSTNFIQTDTAINPGNSGGALVNMYGQVIGITSSKITGTAYEGVGFAIPSKSVKRVVESLIANGNVKDRARLGISYQFFNSAMAELNGMSSHGLLIAEVSDDSDLNGKVAAGDMITRVNDIEINDDAIILDIIEESRPGDVLNFTIQYANGQTGTVSAALLTDEGSSSYVATENENSSGDSLFNNDGTFNFPEGY